MGRYTWRPGQQKWRNREKERLEEEARELQRQLWRERWDRREPLDGPADAMQRVPHERWLRVERDSLDDGNEIEDEQ